ncbi:MAG TPA: nucleotidyltransferase domain-containing protein [Candidatus Nanoarchaeia archaeon]|nr:nucleotidyltransferase domain-containing protein [Candidatus Nanoarchaeia archaeon]
MDKLLKFFINEPEREFYVRELAKILKKSPTTISKFLKRYESKKILISKRKLNHLFFKADANSKKFKQLKLNYNLSLINESGIIDFLEDFFNYPEAIVLFGSFAKAENNKNSDIDLLVISQKKQEPSLEKFEKKLGYNIQLFIHSKEELNRLKKENKQLFNNWINGIVIYGYFEALK